jgi:beta-N-acetylhexosaminidase
VEFVPFKAAIDAKVAFIMTAHLRVTTIDEERPATLSPRIIKDILRDQLGFQGVIVSDDLEMKAIADTYRPGEAAIAAIAAGCDSLLMCGSGNAVDVSLQVEVLESLIHAVEDETLSIARLEDALERNRLAKLRFLRDWRPPSAKQLRQVIGCESHRLVAEQMSAFA